MQYEFRSYTVFDAPQVDVPEAGKTTLTISCVSGVVGDTYAFEKVDNFEFVADNADTITEILAKIQTACEQYVTANYPNT